MQNLPLQLRPVGKLLVDLPTDRRVELPVARPSFEVVEPLDGEFTYGGKPITLDEGERVFVELRLLREMLRDGWDGVWVEVYGGMSFLRTMISCEHHRKWHVDIPPERTALLRSIQKRGKTKSCFDVMAWSGGDVVFLEAKEAGRDQLTEPQRRWISGALDCGIEPSNLVVVEWVRRIPPPSTRG